MIVSDVLSIFFVILGLLLSVPAFCLVARALFPIHTQRMEKVLSERPKATFFTGLGVAVGMAIALAILGALPVQLFKGLAIWGFGVCLGIGLMGAGAIGSLVGGRLASATTPPWKTTMYGGLALGLSCLIPILGWFVMLPGMLVTGVGANALAFLRARAERPIHIGFPAGPATIPAAPPAAPREHVEAHEGAPTAGVGV